MNKAMVSVFALCFLVTGCDETNDETVEQQPDSSSLADVISETSLTEGDAGCGPDAMLLPVHTQPGCDTEPETICVGTMAGDRHIGYCTCKDPNISDDLGWEQGGVAPWFGKGYSLYAEPGCDDSVVPICIEGPWPTEFPESYCLCSGSTGHGTAQGSHHPFSSRGPCDAGAD